MKLNEGVEGLDTQEINKNYEKSKYSWFVRNPFKFIRYYSYLKRIGKANVGFDYDCPTLGWYMQK